MLQQKVRKTRSYARFNVALMEAACRCGIIQGLYLWCNKQKSNVNRMLHRFECNELVYSGTWERTFLTNFAKVDHAFCVLKIMESLHWFVHSNVDSYCWRLWYLSKIYPSDTAVKKNAHRATCKDFMRILNLLSIRFTSRNESIEIRKLYYNFFLHLKRDVLDNPSLKNLVY